MPQQINANDPRPGKQLISNIIGLFLEVLRRYLVEKSAVATVQILIITAIKQNKYLVIKHIHRLGMTLIKPATDLSL